MIRLARAKSKPVRSTAMTPGRLLAAPVYMLGAGLVLGGFREASINAALIGLLTLIAGFGLARGRRD